ncbi:putative transcriptional regulatory protein YxjL [Alicyclobacillus acidoterrestris]|nr:putative transcriptional regulatory protein YxjL [Alicyclobacillus acidoterrestris]
MKDDSKQRIGVLIVDDQRLIREGLHYLIDAQTDMHVTGEANNGDAAVREALQTRPDVILMDVQMPDSDGLTATRRIIEAMPDTKILLLTTFDVVEYVYDGIRAGAVGYLLKDADAAELMDSIRAVYRGEALYRTAAAGEALARAVKNQTEEKTPVTQPPASQPNQSKTLDTPSAADELTERELEVLQEMAWGLRNDEIARKLHISEGTVKTHVHRILQKFNVDDRTQAVVFALRRGIVQ